MNPRKLVALALGLILTATVDAIEVHPTQLLLPRDKPVASLRIGNSDRQDVVVELTANRWLQRHGQDLLEPEPTLIVTPPLVHLTGGESRVIRIGLPAAPPGTDERAYRLVASVFPRADRAEGIRVRTEISLPVFVPAKDTIPVVDVTARPLSGARLCVSAANRGPVHARLAWVGPAPGDATSSPLFRYALPGQTVETCTRMPDTRAPLRAGVISGYGRYARTYEHILHPGAP